MYILTEHIVKQEAIILILIIVLILILIWCHSPSTLPHKKTWCITVSHHHIYWHPQTLIKPLLFNTIFCAKYSAPYFLIPLLLPLRPSHTTPSYTNTHTLYTTPYITTNIHHYIHTITTYIHYTFSFWTTHSFAIITCRAALY